VIYLRKVALCFFGSPDTRLVMTPVEPAFSRTGFVGGLAPWKMQQCLYGGVIAGSRKALRLEMIYA
jgi:hypothetical protein